MIPCTEDGYESKSEVKQLPVAIMKTYTCCIYPHPDPIRIHCFDEQNFLLLWVILALLHPDPDSEVIKNCNLLIPRSP
jgi:hypothetical protein